jgi:hypothetical protein
MVVIPSKSPSFPTATHSVTDGQLTAARPLAGVPSPVTMLSGDQLQVPEAYVPTVKTPLPGRKSSPTAMHSVIDGQLTPNK